MNYKRDFIMSKKSIYILAVFLVIAFFLYDQYKRAQRNLRREQLIMENEEISKSGFDNQKHTLKCNKQTTRRLLNNSDWTISDYKKEVFTKSFCECSAKYIAVLINKTQSIEPGFKTIAEIKASNEYLKMEQNCVKTAAQKVAPVKFSEDESFTNY